jgi:hypothetical protein
MTQKSDAQLCLVGCGDIFDAIANDLAGYGLKGDEVHCVPLEGVSRIADDAEATLASLDAQDCPLFIAVEPHALNHARLELYGKARLRGFRFASLVHKTAHISPSAKLADNVWIGPMALLSHGVKVASNTMICAGVRVDCNAVIGAHGWIGAGCAVGARSETGAHCVLGADITLREGARLGRNSLLDQSGLWLGDIASGTFAENIYAVPARMLGAGYSHQRKGIS